MSIGLAADEIEFAIANDGSGGAALAVGGDGGTFDPFVVAGVVEINVFDWGFAGETSGEGAGDNDLFFPRDGLEVVEFEGWFFSFGPRFGGGVVDIHRLNAASAKA